MARIRKTRSNTVKNSSIVVVIGILLSGCSFVSDGLFPTLTGENPTAKQNIKTNIPPARAESNAQPTLSLTPPPALGRTNFIPPKVSQGTTTGTYVGQRVIEIRGELKRLQSQISQQNTQLQSIRKLTIQNSQNSFCI